MRRNRWSLTSVLITSIGATVIFCTIRYLYWNGLWRTSSKAHTVMSICGAIMFFASLATAIVGLIKDESKTYPIIALLISLVSLLFYVQ